MTLHSDPSLLCPNTPVQPKRGSISLVGAGPGSGDLLTLRALDRLRAADVVYYDRLVDPAVLDLAGPRATKIFVGKHVGAHSWPQARIDAEIVRAALQGLRVVRLKSGDPSIFGRAGEEIAAARAAGIAVEIVPGITAASAAAASLCQPLTERALLDRVVFATGTALTGDRVESLAASLVPGTRLVLYMAMQHLSQIEADLLRHGTADETSVTIVSHCGSADERSLECPLRGMAAAAKAGGMENPAVVMISLPKPVAADQSLAAQQFAESPL